MALCSLCIISWRPARKWGTSRLSPVLSRFYHEARASYEKALALTQQEPERQFLQERIRQLK